MASNPPPSAPPAPPAPGEGDGAGKRFSYEPGDIYDILSLAIGKKRAVSVLCSFLRFFPHSFLTLGSHPHTPLPSLIGHHTFARAQKYGETGKAFDDLASLFWAQLPESR